MKIAILGTGYVASAYARQLLFLGYHPMVLSRAWLDYTDLMALKEFLGHYKPDFLINGAGYSGDTSVDDCEVHRTKTYQSHVTQAATIAKALHGTGIKLIHISSGCMFTGNLLGPFLETEDPNHLAPWYTQCKWKAEQELSGYELRYIFRIRMPFNHQWHPRNLLVKLCNHPRILDGFNSLTFLDEFCMRSWLLAGKSPPGAYNAAYGTGIGILEVARMLHDAGLREAPVVEFPPDEFLKCGHVPRSQAILDPTKFEKAFGAAWGDPYSAIRWCIEQLKETRAQIVPERGVS